MFIHESPNDKVTCHKQTVIRLYDVPNGYEERKPFKATVTIDYETPSKVYVSNLLARGGHLSRREFIKVKSYLRDQGVKLIRYERHGLDTEERL